MAQLNQIACACSSSLFFAPSRRHLLRPPVFSLARMPSFARCCSSSDDTAKPTVGFLGLGIMGTAMATNLIKAGYVDVSTVDGGTSKTICGLVKATGASFLEAPVSGSKKPAQDGTLIFLTAGDKVLYEQAGPLLDVMGKSKFYLGEVGNGAAMKLIVNMVMGSMMASFSEGLVLGDKIGLDPSTIIEVISQGAISSPMFAMKGPSMIKKSFSPAFPLKHQQKDLRLALQLAELVSQPVPVAASVNEMYKVAKSKGFGDQDFSAVIEAIKAD